MWENRKEEIPNTTESTSAAKSESQTEQKHMQQAVTKKEFFLCMVVFLAVVLWQGSSVKKEIRRSDTLMQNNIHAAANRIENTVQSIPTHLEQGIEAANDPLQSSEITIVDVDMQAKTATIRMTALPKVYTKEMAVQFFVFREEAEPISVQASVGADRMFAAEAIVPFCDSVSVHASLQTGDTEQICDLGNTQIDNVVLPTFGGPGWHGTVSWTAGDSYVTFDGEFLLEVAKPEWLLSQRKADSFAFRNARIEVLIDGVLEKTLPMVRTYEVYDAEAILGYRAIVGEEIQLQEGSHITFLFLAEDNNGISYRYLLLAGTNKGAENRWEEETPTEEAERLTISG